MTIEDYWQRCSSLFEHLSRTAAYFWVNAVKDEK